MMISSCVDYRELMGILSRPRANGSPGEKATCGALCDWLSDHAIHHRIHTFTQYPYTFEFIGVWIILSRSLLAAAIWFRWGWLAFAIAVVGLMGGALDVAFRIPLVSWPGRCTGRNILIEFEPAEAKQEVVISAHYDSKTELLDHRQRMFFLKNIRLGIFLTFFLGLFGPLDIFLHNRNADLANLIYWMGVGLTIILLILAWGLGLNLSIGRLLAQSPGAVDNGAACAILLGLAHEFARGELSLKKTRVTVALFTGEEINMQGSRAFVTSKSWDLPAVAVNLEAMAQNGDYVIWQQDGSIFKLESTSLSVSQSVAKAVFNVTTREALPAGPIISDGSSFLAAGIPTAVLGTYDRDWIDAGFHRPSDNLSRVVLERLPEGVDILKQFLLDHEKNT